MSTHYTITTSPNDVYAIAYIHIWRWIIIIDFGFSNKHQDGLPGIGLAWDADQ